MPGNIIKHLVKLTATVLLGLAVIGFIGGTIDKAVPEWADFGNLVRVAGLITLLIVIVAYVVRAVRSRHEPVLWNLKSFLRAPVAAAIVFLVSAAGNILATAFLAGRPSNTGMVGGSIEPAEMPALHYGAPLVGLALAALYLVWPWLRHRPKPAAEESRQIQ